MRAVTKINVSGAGFIPLDKCPCAWPRERVTGLVVLRKIGFILHDDHPASSPNELRAAQFARARERIAPIECSTNASFLHDLAVHSSYPPPPRNSTLQNTSS